jgi:hypothetical protein
VTIDSGDPIPDKFRFGPTLEADVAEMQMEVLDPLRVVARNIRGLTHEQIRKMCTDMGKPELIDLLVNWSVAYIDGGELPLVNEQPKDGRRF